MKKVSIMIPMYNEEQSLPLLYEALRDLMEKEKAYEWEVLCVDDGSRDNTLNMLKELRQKDSRINYVGLSRNFGKENAMLAGFDYVTGDCMIIMDADLQDPPSLIPQMLQYWEEGYEDVYAKRDDRGEESFIRRWCSLLFYRILDRSTRFDILQNVGDFRLLDRICINALRKMRENERYTKGLFCWIGYKKKEVIFNRSNRVAGDSKWNFKSLFNLAIEGITSFTTAPLRLSTGIGMISSAFSFCYMLYFFIKTMLFGDAVQGFPTLIIVVLFLGGIQLISIGIIGEYLGRIFNETKNRPPYLCREYNGNRCELEP